jgi:hypothetical protein
MPRSRMSGAPGSLVSAAMLLLNSLKAPPAKFRTHLRHSMSHDISESRQRCMHIADTASGTNAGRTGASAQGEASLVGFFGIPNVAQARPVLTGTRPVSWLEEPLHSAIWAAACEDVRPPLLGAAKRATPLLPGVDNREPPPDRPADPLPLPGERQENAYLVQLKSIPPSAWRICHPARLCLTAPRSVWPDLKCT